jgi:uncharacterized Ntn-hydrolase superfamily protein
MKTYLILFSVSVLLVSGTVADVRLPTTVTGTFSIAAYDDEFKEFGVAVQSKFPAVGSVVPFAKAGVGAIATQAWGNTTYGLEGLALMNMGFDADTVVKMLTQKDEHKDYRQVGVIDVNGNAAAFTGENCQTWAGHKTGRNFAVQGNILTGENVVTAMAEAFETTGGTLAERLLAALEAGQAAGGDSRGQQSAAMLIVRKAGGYGGLSDRAIDVRVDDHPEPIAELRRVFKIQNGLFGVISYLQSFAAFQDSHDMDTADACLMRAVVMAEKTDDIPAAYLNAVAWTLVENKRELARALALAEKTVALESENPAFLDTLATIHYLKGNHDQAVTIQQKAVKLAPEDSYYSDKLNEWKEK